MKASCFRLNRSAGAGAGMTSRGKVAGRGQFGAFDVAWSIEKSGKDRATARPEHGSGSVRRGVSDAAHGNAAAVLSVDDRCRPLSSHLCFALELLLMSIFLDLTRFLLIRDMSTLCY
ncbi:PREDICTED: uncharacterized protein LOC106128378 [Papilio xuthus]|uniref:Uncharacterized protein LOC106128378 n=1 Tax=Papilio xuthus TaxID=66420 RepID=A0AAJ7ELF0_PAPXU|nr:PREDICTED: uncharacterized protein LOC106128378 [Papilio xuthus]